MIEDLCDFFCVALNDRISLVSYIDYTQQFYDDPFQSQDIGDVVSSSSMTRLMIWIWITSIYTSWSRDPLCDVIV